MRVSRNWKSKQYLQLSPLDVSCNLTIHIISLFLRRRLALKSVSSLEVSGGLTAGQVNIGKRWNSLSNRISASESPNREDPLG